LKNSISSAVFIAFRTAFEPSQVSPGNHGLNMVPIASTRVARFATLAFGRALVAAVIRRSLRSLILRGEKILDRADRSLAGRNLRSCGLRVGLGAERPDRETVKMPRRDGGQGLCRPCNYGRGALGIAMSNGTLAKLVMLTIALAVAIVWLGADRHVGCKVNCPADISARNH